MMTFEQPKTRSTGKKMQEMRRSAGVEDEDLVVMNLSGMFLHCFPVTSVNLGAICKLDLSNNNLQKIPESLTARLLNLIVLDVHSNQLLSLPNSIGCLSKLKVLKVSGNLLKVLPRTIENCRSLEELNANFNMLQQLPDTIGFELVNLKKLSVNSNKLIFLPHSTSHLTNLRILDVRLNCLRSLPDDLENLINLEVLNVSQNFQYLETLPYSIGLLASLIDLDVSYNKITALPESIGCLRKIQKLSVEGNPLVSPPPEVIEGGLVVIKNYLCEKMNGLHQTPRKRTSWLGKFARCTTFSGGSIPHDDREGIFVPKYKAIDGLASPGFMGMLSPKRLFSSKRHSVDGSSSPRFVGVWFPKSPFSPTRHSTG